MAFCIIYNYLKKKNDVKGVIETDGDGACVLQEADFILVVCSLGARLRCSKKRVRFREEAGRLMPDYFAVAVDYVAEKLRVERSKGLGVGKFITVVMDYSRLSDVPPQLEAAASFSLIRDFHSLCLHLATTAPNSQHKSPDLGEEGVDAWQQTEAGAEMWAALGQAREYFKTHPNWLEDRLEPLPPRSRAKSRRRRHHDHDSNDVPLLPMTQADMTRHSAVDVNTSANVTIDDHSSRQRSAPYFIHSRQNSLPSSLCSSQPPASTCVQQTVSRSVDSFPPSQPFGRDFGEGSTCLLCQQQKEGWGAGGRRVHCPHHPQDRVHVSMSDTDGDSELELGMDAEKDLKCSRSKSLPSVGLPLPSSPHLVPLPTSRTVVEGFTNTALSRSRTILHAEVHKEWGPSKEGDSGRDGVTIGQTDSKPGRGLTLSQDRPGDELDRCRVPPAPKVWDLSKVPEAPKDWNSVIRPCGRVSPSSVSSESSASSFSAGHSGSDSLERDLRSITMPRIFDNTTDSAFLTSVFGVTPPRSLSSSALLSATDGILRPVPCLTLAQPASPDDFTFDISPLQWDGREDVLETGHDIDCDTQSPPLCLGNLDSSNTDS